MISVIKKAAKQILPPAVLDLYHFLMPAAAAAYFGFPSKKVKVLGVTGTNGKSTVVEMASRIFEDAGFKTAALSSIKFKIGRKEEKNYFKMTMPGRFFVQSFLKKAAKAQCDYAIIEVTSEGIKQHRHRFIDFQAAVFTNLTPEHIEAHGSFENYKKEKGKLFKAAKKVHIVNADDENAEYFLGFEVSKKFCYHLAGREKSKAEGLGCTLAEAEDIASSKNGISFNLKGTRFNLGLFGEFNVYNALAAICLAQSQGIGLDVCQRALASIDAIQGRMEQVLEKPKVFVDYAFTPNALKQVYQALRKDFLKGSGKLVCLLGACGGGRDKWKRPVLGEIAASFCDRIILSNEDPYDEDPMEIIASVKKGVLQKKYSPKNLYEILDRREAVRKGLEITGPNDVFVLTGKGCEPWICLAGGKKIPWDEKQIILEEARRLKKFKK